MARLEFFFDVGSPTAYLAYTQLPGIASRTGAEIRYRPILLGGVFKATGNRAPGEVAPKGAYMLRDLQRYAARYGVPYAHNPNFPINTILMMRGAVAAQRLELLPAYLGAIFAGMWVEQAPMQDPQEVGRRLVAAGIDVSTLLPLTEDQSVKDELRINTEEAVRRGTFGAPTFFVGDEMFFGQDRLDFVEDELRRAG
ncbi:MAG: 2-hydroxychromene-2-carboxylate isomerase [Alphaproteobacteria bacterium]|jgi:2-hydroxychromene-2-carboxylate isomerase|nr:2-hydroxychromene-2-carboxylate isomerase [Alphaproteobacteria bacterium]